MGDLPGRIEVTGLSKAYGGVRVVDALGFTAEPGAITGLLGPNGAGKSTALRMLLGLARPDAGCALIGGRPYSDIPEPATQVGAVLETAGFHPARTGRNHLRAYCRMNGLALERADEVLDLVGLRDAARRAVRGYSLGMRQRLGLAHALLGDPQSLILDEPANGLDPEGIIWLRGLLRDMATDGRTVFVASHVLSEIQQLVDQIVVISRGRCVYQGALSNLASDTAGLETAFLAMTAADTADKTER